MPAIYFIIMVGVLVFVHELGHFAWAKVFGVRVLRFSLGFGPRVAGFRRGDTEYVVSALPLGGYVRMLGENPLDEVGPRDLDRSFARQSLLRRVVIVAAGPAMNLVFPLLLYFVVFLGDTHLTPPTIGMVFPGRPAHGELLPGDRIVEVDGEPIETFYALTRAIEDSPGRDLDFTFIRDGAEHSVTLKPVRSRRQRPLERSDDVGRIGIMPNHPAAVIGIASPTSPAAAARLRTFDVVVSAGGKPTERYIDLEAALHGNRGALVPLTYLRPTPVPDALGGLVELDVYEARVAAVTPEPGKGSGAARAGIESANLYLSHVTAGSPEHRMGLLPGDRLLDLDGRRVQMWETFLEDLRIGRGVEHTLRWRRGGEETTGNLTLAHEHGVTEHGQVYDRYAVGIRNWVPTRIDPRVDNPNPISYAVREAWRATWEVVELTIFSVVRLLQGRLTVKSIGGPLTIFEVAGDAAQQGALNYLTLMAFISINLGLINLFPIPLLDGGHMMFLLTEAVMRRPLSVRIRGYAHIAGFVFLVAIMFVAFKNDLERQWPQIVETLGRR